MTQAVAHIINEIEQLSVLERIEVRRLIAQSVPMTDDLTEDDFAVIAAESFRTLGIVPERGEVWQVDFGESFCQKMSPGTPTVSNFISGVTQLDFFGGIITFQFYI